MLLFRYTIQASTAKSLEEADPTGLIPLLHALGIPQNLPVSVLIHFNGHLNSHTLKLSAPILPQIDHPNKPARPVRAGCTILFLWGRMLEPKDSLLQPNDVSHLYPSEKQNLGYWPSGGWPYGISQVPFLHPFLHIHHLNRKL